MDTLSELRQLAGAIVALGDNDSAALVRKAIDRFMAWKFDAGERLLELALESRRQFGSRNPPHHHRRSLTACLPLLDCVVQRTQDIIAGSLGDASLGRADSIA